MLLPCYVGTLHIVSRLTRGGGTVPVMQSSSISVFLLVTGVLSLLIQVAALVLTLVLRRRLGPAATTCAALGFGLMVLELAGTFLLSFTDLASLTRILILQQLSLVALVFVAAAVFLGRRDPAPMTGPPAAGTFTIGSPQPFPDVR